MRPGDGGPGCLMAPAEWPASPRQALTLLDGAAGLCLLFNELCQHILSHIHSHSRAEHGVQAFCFLHVPMVEQWENFCPFL